MKKVNSRLGIFVFFDRDGKVDRYVCDLLSDLQKNVDTLVLVSNGPLDENAQETLKPFCNEIFSRENHGLDAAAFKEAMVTFCGWERIQNYDEIVLVNDTFFGPIVPLQKVFQEMEEKDVDFWGLSAGYHSDDGFHKVKYGYIPDHIQTFFVAFRKKMVCSDIFREYWYQYNDSTDEFIDVVTGHEMIMTRYFEDLGFRWGVYANTEYYQSQYNSENFNIYHFRPYKMMRELKFPVLKRKIFNLNIPDQLYMCDIEESAEALHYLETETDYDTSMIWENILRLYNVSDIYYSLHLNYVLSKESIPVDFKKAAVIVRVCDQHYKEDLWKTLASLPKELDIYLIWDCEAERTTDFPKSIKLLPASNQQTDMGAFILSCQPLIEKYEYLCFVHDFRNPDHAPLTVGESALYAVVQNMILNEGYVSQILNCFKNYPQLGLLGIPPLLHYHYFEKWGDQWGAYYAETQKLAEQLQIRCNLDQKKSPILTEGVFWCRTKAIMPLWNRTYAAYQFHCNAVTKISVLDECLKRILCYVAQSEGYYSGTVMNARYAEMRISDLQYLLNETIEISRERLHCTANITSIFLEQMRDVSQGGTRLSVASRVTSTVRVKVWLKNHLPDGVWEILRKIYKKLKRKS